VTVVERNMLVYRMMVCSDCRKEVPQDRFNPDSFSPGVCFKCRVSGVSIGFGGYKDSFHGDNLVGGTVASDVRNTVAEGRAQGHDPVPAKAPNPGVTQKTLDVLKTKSGYGGGGKA
jgi:hypothetical protein